MDGRDSSFLLKGKRIKLRTKEEFEAKRKELKVPDDITFKKL